MCGPNIANQQMNKVQVTRPCDLDKSGAQLQIDCRMRLNSQDCGKDIFAESSEYFF